MVKSTVATLWNKSALHSDGNAGYLCSRDSVVLSCLTPKRFAGYFVFFGCEAYALFRRWTIYALNLIVSDRHIISSMFETIKREKTRKMVTSVHRAFLPITICDFFCTLFETWYNLSVPRWPRRSLFQLRTWLGNSKLLLSRVRTQQMQWELIHPYTLRKLRNIRKGESYNTLLKMSPLFCLSLCLLVSEIRISQKLMKRFPWKFVESVLK